MLKGLKRFISENTKFVIGSLIVLIIIMSVLIYNKWKKSKSSSSSSSMPSSSSSSLPSSAEKYHYIGAAIGSGGLLKSLLEGEGGSVNLSGGLSDIRIDEGTFSRDPSFDTVRTEAESEVGNIGYSGYQPTTSGLILDPMGFSSLSYDPSNLSFGQF